MAHDPGLDHHAPRPRPQAPAQGRPASPPEARTAAGAFGRTHAPAAGLHRRALDLTHEALDATPPVTSPSRPNPKVIIGVVHRMMLASRWRGDGARIIERFDELPGNASRPFEAMALKTQSHQGPEHPPTAVLLSRNRAFAFDAPDTIPRRSSPEAEDARRRTITVMAPSFDENGGRKYQRGPRPGRSDERRIGRRKDGPMVDRRHLDRCRRRSRGPQIAPIGSRR